MNANPLSPNLAASQSAGPARDSKFSSVDPMRVLRQYVWLLMITAVLSVVLGVGLWLGLKRVWPRYTSIAQLTITGGISDPYQVMQQGARWDQGMDLIDAFIMNQILRLNSDEVLDGALRRDDVRATSWFRSFKNDVLKARQNLKTSLEATKIRKSTVIQVSFTAGNKEDPPIILDAVISVYLEKIAVETGRESDSVRLAFVRERDRAEEYVQQVEEQIKQYTLQNDLPAMETRNHEASIIYKAINEQKTQLEMALQAAREAYPALLSAQRGGANFSPQQVAEAEADRTVQYRNEQVAAYRTRREVLRERFGDKHPMVREIDLVIAATEREKKNLIEQIIRKKQAVQLEQAKSAINSLESQLEGMRPAIEENRAQMRDLGVTLDEHNRLQARAHAAVERRRRAEELLNSMRIQSDRPDSTQVRPVFNATVAELSSPKGKVIVPGVMLLLTGMVTGIAFLKESLDQRIKSPADMSLSRQCPLLGVIPDATEDPSNPQQVEGVVRTHPTGLMAESYRQIRTTLLTQIERHGYKTLLLVGPQPHSGTSVVANNLALSFAHDGKKVLLLDANYRKPDQHRLFGVGIEPGLVEALAGLVTVDQAVVHLEQSQMDLLPVGNVADALPEMFESSTFSDLLTKLKDRYDLILIDVPPGLLTSDGYLMAKYVDAVAVVVRAVQDRRGMIGRMLRQLDGHGAQVIGVILNGVRSSAGGYFRKNYQAFYRYRLPELNRGSKRRIAPDSEPDLDLVVDPDLVEVADDK